jgi:DedD protein
MDVQLQQRIVGAIVLVTLGVIFIPALLDGSGYRTRQVQDIKVKEKPEFPPVSQKAVKPIATPLEKKKTSQSEAKKVTDKQPDKKKPVKKPIKSFALQIGTFDDNAKAVVLRDKMRKAGYTTFIRKSVAKGKTSYKVRIGPELDYDALEKVKKKVKKSHRIDAYIVNHP